MHMHGIGLFGNAAARSGDGSYRTVRGKDVSDVIGVCEYCRSYVEYCFDVVDDLCL